MKYTLSVDRGGGMIFSKGGGGQKSIKVSVKQQESTMPLKSLKLINDYYC